MDKIKILAAVLALAGCMESGMGMEVHNSNEIFKDHIDNRGYLVVTPENIDYVATNEKHYDGNSLKLYKIDFTKYSDNLGNICKIMSWVTYLEFQGCMFNRSAILGFPGCYNTIMMRFIKCAGVEQTDSKWLSQHSNYDNPTIVIE